MGITLTNVIGEGRGRINQSTPFAVVEYGKYPRKGRHILPENAPKIKHEMPEEQIGQSTFALVKAWIGHRSELQGLW